MYVVCIVLTSAVVADSLDSSLSPSLPCPAEIGFDMTDITVSEGGTETVTVSVVSGTLFSEVGVLVTTEGGSGGSGSKYMYNIRCSCMTCDCECGECGV